ncbi:MAG TPA: 2-oxoglutarate dehydrogenase E1 component [Longimicrobiaceae bacterium]|nr:2-oxoglutarate dehydrogenase E1 component [Longimicrobiaceae bacterium]
MSDLRSFYGPNAGYVLEQYERFQQDPASVDPEWRSYFENFRPTDAVVEIEAGGDAAGVPIETILSAHRLAQAIRARGHTASRLDPLGSDPEADPALSPSAYGITEADLERLPSSVVRATGHIAGRTRTAAEAIGVLREIYSGTTGYDFGHIHNPEERRWLRDRIESGDLAQPLPDEQKKQLLVRLSQVEGFERYLHKTYFGQKRFSIEGTDALVPILDEVIRAAAGTGTRTALIGMAHRGRLNVLTHVLGKPYDLILAGFKGAAKSGSAALAPDDFTGDVKYHMGWDGVREGTDPEVRVTLAPNPSHLEFVNPVVIGMVRAVQDDTSRPGSPPRDLLAALPILVHGDAAFPGQGVVSETLNMSGLRGYTVGGTLHIIANNQVGFTTSPSAARSTRYASDLAKGFEIPVVHVNADDIEACIAAARLAATYRERYQKDFLIDIVGYRRWGHNEGDEPLFTQPLMYEVIRTHPTVREQWAAKLIEQGVVTAEEADEIVQTVYDRLEEVREGLGEGTETDIDSTTAATTRELDLPMNRAAVTGDALVRYNDAMLAWPEGFHPNSRLAKQLERRREAMGPEGGIDWGHAETLAFASLLSEGTPVRLTGQDVQRGTFSHRHQVLVDAETGEAYAPLANLPTAKASFEIHNSPLSEMAVVGFEYGYSVSDPEVLVVWEAQFGDFANGAQVIIDQFMAGAEVKWQQTSGMVMLLPHGYEGQGPEHSSARLERFLQLAAQGNLRVANCTTSAQYFHLLRRQAMLLGRDARPLIVMSPKSLLRHPIAASRLQDLAEGSFQPVLGDPEAETRRDEITRLLLCSGKVYADLMAGEERKAAVSVALARMEEMYPFPKAELRAQLELYPSLQEIVWVQEEPKNMGGWSFLQPRLVALVEGSLPVRYEGRPHRASPAEGYADKHLAEQARIVKAAWEGAPQRPRQRQAQRA